MSEGPAATVQAHADDHGEERRVLAQRLHPGDGMAPHVKAQLDAAKTEAEEEDRRSMRTLMSNLLTPKVNVGTDDEPRWDSDGDPVEFWDVWCFRDVPNSYWVFGVVDRDGARVETRRLRPDEMPSGLPDAVWAAAPGCLIEVPDRRSKRGKAKWREIRRAIYGAAKVGDAPEPAAGDWKSRLERYLRERLTTDRDEAVRRFEPFEEDGHVHVHRESFQRFVNRELGLSVTKGEVQDGLRTLGESKEVNYHPVKGEERRSKRDYWWFPADVSEELLAKRRSERP